MPRQVRIEFAGAFYQAMARGDRGEAIVRDDEERRTFVRTLGEAAERAGFRVHAWVLMDNHYHLLLETPEANLSAGRRRRNATEAVVGRESRGMAGAADSRSRARGV